MLITRECDYALRILRAMSRNEKVTVNHICETGDVPLPFAYKILKKLGQAGIVQSIRGISGGYILKADLDKITIYDIICAVEERFHINECMVENYCCSQNKSCSPCIYHQELKRVQEIMKQELSSKSLAQIFRAC